MNPRSAWLVVACLLPCPARGGEPLERPMAPGDIYAFHVVDALEVSPDGRTLAFTTETYVKSSDALSETLYLMPAAGGTPKGIGRKGQDATHPRFSRDGRRLAFLLEAGGGAQVAVARADGTHATVVTRMSGGVSAFDWSPDGRWLVVVSGESRSARRSATDPWVITRSLIERDGEGFLTSEHEHLWIVAAVKGGPAPRALTSGPYDDSDPRWSPDGKWIAFVSNRTADPDANDNTDVYVIRPDGSGLRAVAANPGPDETPRWSHASDRIAFVGGLRPNDFYQSRPLMVASVAGGAPLNLSASLDTWVAADALLAGSETWSGAAWSPDDSTLYVPFQRRGADFLAALPSRGGAARELFGGRRHVETVRLAPDGARFFVTVGDATHLPEVHAMAVDGTGLTRLTHLNDAFLDRVTLSVPEKIVARNDSGDDVESWLYPPVGLDPSKRYPLVLYIHGGPEGYDGDYFDTGLENQVLPGAGYAVLRVNYRGSTSYGERFCRAIWGDWHSREFEDLMSGLDETLRQKAWIDPERLGVGGWSYGGIMTLWTVGHTDRFKVGVPERFSFDYRSIFGEDQWFSQYLEELGDPYGNEETYRRLSPSTYLPRTKTPLYLIADEKDGNCPPSQAMQAYQRLRLLGRKPELVIYPGEPHVMARPSHLVDRLQRLVTWFGRHLSAPEPSAKMPLP
jgi:dipeptidyl aminopeptidase/acylaminoacyl peptidase